MNYTKLHINQFVTASIGFIASKRDRNSCCLKFGNLIQTKSKPIPNSLVAGWYRFELSLNVIGTTSK